MKVNITEPNKSFKRLNEIYKVLKKNDFGYLIEENTFFKKFPFLRNRKKEETERFLDETVPSRIRMVFEDLGPAYIKLGQMLSTRPDLISIETAQELQKLRDNTPVIPFDEILEIIKEELGTDPMEIFESIDEEPLGSASIGQVHKGVLKENNEEVAIKIRKPGTKEVIKSDVKIMKVIAKTIDKYISQTHVYNFPAIVNEFERSIFKEIDYTEELRNMEHLAHNFKKDNTIHIPDVYNEYSSEKMIVMELIHGVEISEVVKDENDSKYNRKLIAKRLINSYFKQIILDGFFHADPHPGNIFIMENNVLCYIDEGMMGSLTEEFRKNLAQLLLTLISKDATEILNQLEYMDIINQKQITSELEDDINDLMNKYYINELGTKHNIFEDLINVMIKHHVQLPREFVNIGRGLGLIEEVGLKLDPSFTPEKEIKRLSKKIILKRYSPKTLSKNLFNFTLELQHLTKNLPDRINGILYRFENSEIDVKVELRGLNKSIDKLSFSLVISALIIGSSLVLLTSKGPKFFDLPVLGLFGFVLSAALGFFVVFKFMEKSD